jgi:cystathionine beta-lyase
VDFLCAYFAQYIPDIRVVRPEGTYLVWLDCRGLGLDTPQLKRLFQRKARVYPEAGTDFGPAGEGFIRINVGCPRPVLKQALSRIRAAVAGRRRI